jgi:hypothetical protein
MLEQKDSNNNISEETKNIENEDLLKKEELVQVDDTSECLCEASKTIKPSFIDTLKASLVDLIVIGGISAALVFLGDAILRLSGYFVTQKFEMSFIIFMIVMVLYMSIMESGKNSTTLGKKISGLIITKG